MPHSSPNPIILLGDHATVAHRGELAGEAATRGCAVVDAFGFDDGAAAGAHDLTQVEAVVAALGRAITCRTDIWVPFPGRNFIREQHLRRLSLVLQRHGLTLLLYRELYRVPTVGGISEIDQALRIEVQAVDNLDRAALAAAGTKSLIWEIELALTKIADTRAVRRTPDRGRGTGPAMPPALPPPSEPWTQRKRPLKHYAAWLVHGCGVTQAATARVLNSAGQRTPTGRHWKPATVSKLLTGKYDDPRRPGDVTSDVAAG
ncbi:hypothetical protein [Mycolicibacter heraklionensis]|uniref:hypothetical protein n=1 Tax=Mycolicibacter heraklionensis TaxID=512402 RepID=UPI0007EA689F|nr:hypothetical protein [Mycolicibacter heraklionensis]OBG34918.1 hypothetical protein A5671_03695 [Mycolicibacter heraklionensis]